MTESIQYFSPKRKREPSESDYCSPSPSTASDHSIEGFSEGRGVEETDLGSHSPRTAVAGRFQNLAIRSQIYTTPGDPSQLSLSTRPRWSELASFGSESRERNPVGVTQSAPVSRSEGTGTESFQSSISTKFDARFSLDNVTGTPVAMPPKRRPMSPSISHSSSTYQAPNPRMSPPTSTGSRDNPLTWHDHEITGHNPTDPNDDGYGINGVGFKPTAAIAWARSQKRQRQVAEWRSREAREARQKRRERRHQIPNGGEPLSSERPMAPKRVKFDDQGSG
ncbi:hypothetical protein POX_b02966 [Penicillium oxalicum]|uniref:hypothetical protein n=1 Tax=Penicillium oxalicum TaxID=69781 RepID=UPI0020B6F9FE|nr:hypothetical protein POX_b02966 [Penicillium oxalicum]KAI2792922.1 hypothetical protein POX_b02966 [Penicillium oxalicum]